MLTGAHSSTTACITRLNRRFLHHPAQQSPALLTRACSLLLAATLVSTRAAAHRLSGEPRTSPRQNTLPNSSRTATSVPCTLPSPARAHSRIFLTAADHPQVRRCTSRDIHRLLRSGANWNILIFKFYSTVRMADMAQAHVADDMSDAEALSILKQVRHSLCFLHFFSSFPFDLFFTAALSVRFLRSRC